MSSYSLPEINEFTAPVTFTLFAWISLFYFLYNFFEEVPTTDNLGPKEMQMTTRQKAQNELAQSSTCFGTISVYVACLLGCMFLNASLKGPMACFESLGIQFAESRFGFHRGHVGLVIAAVGFLGAATLLFMKLSITTNTDDTLLVLSGLSTFILGIVMNLWLDKENPENNSKTMYVISMFLIYSVGYPISHTALVGLFSKVVGRRPQGTLLGIYGASGTAARVLFPIISGYIVAFQNIESVFFMLALVLGTSMIIILVFRKTLVKLSE